MIRPISSLIKRLLKKTPAEEETATRETETTAGKTDNRETLEPSPPIGPDQTLSPEKKSPPEPSKTSRPAKTTHPEPSEKPVAEKPAPPKKKRWSLDQFQVPEEEGKTRFHDFGLPLNLMHALADLEFQYAMPVQAEVIPCTLQGQDATARAQTGTGKSAAFLITIITRLVRNPIKGKRAKAMPRALILAPTRELVLQIEKDAKALAKYSNLHIVSIFGGMGYQKQQDLLDKRPVDIIAATPGRLIDFTQQKIVKPGKVEVLVIDEADRMLDMGFIPDIRRIIYSTPHKETRQTLFFSATLSPEILRIASQWTKDPAQIEIDPDTKAAENINQKVYIVTEEEKFVLLYNLVSTKNLERVILFVNRRDTTQRIAGKLDQYGIKSSILSGAVSQSQRIRTLDNFKKGKSRILVATDVAARGLHIEGVSHVVNYDLPQDPEHYIHRIGRTGRAGAEGISVSFADENSSFYIPEIEKVLENTLECEYPDEEMLKPLPKPVKKRQKPQKKYPPKSGKKGKPRPRGGEKNTRKQNHSPKQPKSRPAAPEKNQT
ncbi:MAG TPA: DEAD/DEAH box helicase [Desulfobacteraceae bacterium]|nr:DEAD/DEAH box helicase [Desulfobacteraceae bacterium]